MIFGFGAADAAPAAAEIAVKGVGAPGFDRPLFATSAPGDPDRLYVVEQQTGRVMILDPRTGAVSDQPFLDIPDELLAPGSDQGLLGLAFHPDYARNGRFFVHATAPTATWRSSSIAGPPATPTAPTPPAAT